VSFEAVLTMVVQVLEEAGVPYMLTGSVAGAYYALPRATQDVDFVIDAPPARIQAVANGLRARGLYVSQEAAEQAFQAQGQFNAIDPERGWKVDLIFRKDRPFSKAEFARRKPAMLVGVSVSLPTPEDLIVAKLEWSEMGGFELQRPDVVQLVEAGGRSLDRSCIERWVEDLGLQSAWAAILDRASLPPDNRGNVR
jgi:hypothetical protein